jgi:hypothetical protein
MATAQIFPGGCKVAYTKGNFTVLVIEQKPQVRTVAFSSELVETQTNASHAVGRTDTGYRYSLSFPYVYFFMVFDKGQYFYHQMYFRNKPMTSVREHIHLAPLPNVYRDDKNETYKSVCMGSTFNSDLRALNLPIARQVEVVVSEFWQRTFSRDLGNGQPESVDAKIKDYATWQDNSKKDPLFILNVNWPKGKTIKGVIESALDSRALKHELDPVDQSIRTKLEQGVAKLTERIKKDIQKAKTIGLSQSDLDQMSKSLLEETILAHAKRVFEQCGK